MIHETADVQILATPGYAGCENNIQSAMTSLGGVDKTDADHDAKTVQVDYDPDTTSSDELWEDVEEMGYRIADR